MESNLGINLRPMARDFSISTETFTPTSHDVVDGVITAGTHKLLRFDFASYNAGNKDLDVGRPEDNPDSFVFSSGHGHYHLSDFNNYTLFDSQGRKVGDSYKQAFCLMDTTRVGSSADPSAFYTCDYQGISAGWADWYQSTLPGQ